VTNKYTIISQNITLLHVSTLKYLCNLVRHWLQAPWRWHDCVETCGSVIVCEIIVHLLVIVQNNKRCTVHVLKLKKIFLSVSTILNPTFALEVGLGSLRLYPRPIALRNQGFVSGDPALVIWYLLMRWRTVFWWGSRSQSTVRSCPVQVKWNHFQSRLQNCRFCYIPLFLCYAYVKKKKHLTMPRKLLCDVEIVLFVFQAFKKFSSLLMLWKLLSFPLPSHVFIL
jgi:hypothetical protein